MKKPLKILCLFLILALMTVFCSGCMKRVQHSIIKNKYPQKKIINLATKYLTEKYEEDKYTLTDLQDYYISSDFEATYWAGCSLLVNDEFRVYMNINDDHKHEFADNKESFIIFDAYEKIVNEFLGNDIKMLTPFNQKPSSDSEIDLSDLKKHNKSNGWNRAFIEKFNGDFDAVLKEKVHITIHAKYNTAISDEVYQALYERLESIKSRLCE